MESMHAVNDELRPDDDATPGSPLLEQLYQLYTAERQLALDLSVLFHQSTSIPMRLDLSDRRKETTRHLLRLERIIQMTSGNPASHVVAGMMTLRPSAIELSETGVTLEVELQVLRAAMVGYEAAISTAADAHFQPMSISAAQETEIRARYGLQRPFVMYTGGIDHRTRIRHTAQRDLTSHLTRRRIRHRRRRATTTRENPVINPMRNRVLHEALFKSGAVACDRSVSPVWLSQQPQRWYIVSLISLS